MQAVRASDVRALWPPALAGVIGLAAYAPFYGRRNDYPGHFIAGFAGQLLLLALFGLITRRPLVGWALIALAIAIGIGAITEATIFRLAVFDPVDFFNQSLGATTATAAVIGMTLEGRRGVTAGALAMGFLVIGFALAFS